MPTAVTMPQLGESVVEGTVNRWLKAPGEAVDKLEPLLEIATDKIDTEVPSPAAGVLLGVLVAEGETVDAGTVLAFVGAPGQTMPAEVVSDPPASVMPDTRDERIAPGMPEHRGRSFISPVVARIAAENDVDLADVSGTGLGGRITKKNVLRHVEAQRTGIEDRGIDAVREDAGSSIPATRSPDPSEDETLQPLTTMRRVIAEHMVRSVHTSPHVTTVHEVDMTAVVQHREAHRTAATGHGFALTYTPYFLAATVAGLKVVPELNGRFTEEGIVVAHRIHIGVAVAVESGLLVPVVRNADERNLMGLARAVDELASQARNGELLPDQLLGGAFTITNHGIGGSLLSTPIINQPQAGILGVGAIVKRPVVRSGSSSLLPDADDAIAIRPMCYLSLAFDHRVLDGARADVFLRTVKETLENWTEREG